jgi:hypothetical protein
LCLGDATMKASRRLMPWSRDHKLWNHVNDYLRGSRWPVVCRHPSCNTSYDDETSFQFHLIDNHGFSRTRPGHACADDLDTKCSEQSSLASADMQGDTHRKRKPVDDDSTLTWMPMLSPGGPARSPRKSRTSPTVCPSLISSTDTTIDCDSSHPIPSSTKTHLLWSPVSSILTECGALLQRVTFLWIQVGHQYRHRCVKPQWLVRLSKMKVCFCSSFARRL